MDTTDADRLLRYRALLAPGTPFRDGLDRILLGRTGALVVLGQGDVVAAASTGGFQLNVPFTPTALRELAKMDGGIIVSDDLFKIVAAGVHLMPDASVPTAETGTRHRTADRLSRQSGVPVVTVSASMSTIALYLDGRRHLVERSEAIFTRGNQALATLARYRERLLDIADHLSALEISDQVTVRDVALVAQRLELVRRLEEEVRECIALLGVDGRFLHLQQHELTLGLTDIGRYLELDYATQQGEGMNLARLRDIGTEPLLDPNAVARALDLGSSDDRLAARGRRQLATITRLPGALAPRVLDHFDGLQGLLNASRADLAEVDGIGAARAHVIREGLLRLTEAAYSRLS